jgi:hypothetical protein
VRLFFGVLPPRTGDDQALVDQLLSVVGQLNDVARKSWLEAEYLGRLSVYDRRERTWLQRQTIVSVSLVGFGLLGSVSAAVGTGSGALKTVAIIAGALVASLTTINQVWSPASRAEAYRAGCADMRDEGWDYVLGLGSYTDFKEKPASSSSKPSKQPNPLGAFDSFNRRTGQIDKRTRDVDRTRDVGRHR